MRIVQLLAALMLLLGGATACNSGSDCDALNDRLDDAIERGDEVAEQQLAAEGESEDCLDS